MKLLAPITVVMLYFVIVSCRSVYGEEITAFRLTDVNGFIGVRYRHDGELTQQTGSPEAEDMRTYLEEEVNIQTHGYVYHPKFLNFNLGGGVVYSQEDLETEEGDMEHDDRLTNLNARLLFLESKPYPLTLYYDKSHPQAALSVTDVYVQENEKYGMNFSLRQPLLPVMINFESYRQSNKGDSFTQITDEKNTYHSVNAYYGIANGGFIDITHTQNLQESESGLKTVPINPFKVDSKTSDLNSRFFFGKQNNIKLDVIYAKTELEEDRDLKEERFSPYLTWEHNKQLSSYYQYRMLDREQLDIDTKNISGALGVRYKPDENFFSSGEIHFEDNDTTGLTLKSSGVSGSLTYKHPLDFGVLQVSLGVNYDEYDRDADTSTVQMIDVQYTLVGSTPVTLAHDNIDVSTIVVRREDNGDVLTEGIDYLVTQIGDQTQIEKIIGAGLPDPLIVLVSYEYNPGGSAEYSSLGQNYQINLDFNKHYTAYLNYREREQNLESGTPTIPLDSSDTTTYGFRMDYPLPTDIDMTIGGEIANEKHDENISSYRRKSVDIFMQMALPLASNLHLSMKRLDIDHLYSDEDVELTRYAIRLRSRPANRLSLLLQLSDEKDTGGSLPRSSKNLSLTGQWRIRKLLAELGVRRILETQGSIEYERTILNATLRREF